jgi:hypothetical protein
MRKITHNDVILFDTKEQLQEYISLSGDADFFEIEVNNEFPQIQSKHWSFCVNENYGRDMWEVKKTALTRLVSYDYFKNHQ